MNPWTPLQQALAAILAFFYEIIPNYGIAIILLTITISLIMFPLTLKQTRSMKAMQDIQPDVKRLQKELKDDKQALNEALMALYKERGVNPAAGCLPLILQMPIWFALFSVLRVSVDPETGMLNPDNLIPADSSLADALIAGDTWFLGLNLEVSASSAFAESFVTAIPYLILIVLVIASNYYQQLQTTRKQPSNNNENPQAQSMQRAMKILPLFMGFISWGFPSGLVLYFFTSALFRIGQQALILRLDAREAGAEPAEEGATETEAPDGEPDTSKPKGLAPNASKKRNKRRRK